MRFASRSPRWSAKNPSERATVAFLARFPGTAPKLEQLRTEELVHKPMNEVVMPSINEACKARHLDGGNRFDNMLIDIAESHRKFENLPRSTKSIRKSAVRNRLSLYLTGLGMRLRLHPLLVMSGVRRKWLDDFRAYWHDVLEGRPLSSPIDFFMLTHDYRRRQQHSGALEWGPPEKHLANWQNPQEFYATLHFAGQLALGPIRGLSLWKRVPYGATILEYGCSLAPYYYCYRQFFSHLDCHWILADIPNFPFHYAKHLYRSDPRLDFVTIDGQDFSDPLGHNATRGSHVSEKISAGVDVVILTTVLEHVDDPLFVAKYLLDRLKPGGLFVFDFIRSDGTGLDHPSALAARQECLRHILGRTQIVQGTIGDIDESVGVCLAMKRDEEG